MLQAGAAMGGGDYTKGWIPLANHTKWVPPFRHPDADDVIANDADWPSVHWSVTGLVTHSVTHLVMHNHSLFGTFVVLCCEVL
jgi:hypothetical protein